MSTLTGQWSLQKFGEALISSIRFGLFVINKSIHVADVWVIRVGSHIIFLITFAWSNIINSMIE